MWNPFRVPTPAEVALYEQMAERERWEHACRAVGATIEQIRAFDASALAYAQRTLWPDHQVVEAARAAALRRLMAGEPMPTDAEALHAEDRQRALVASILWPA